MTDKTQRAADKVSRIPIKIDHSIASPRKPPWIRVKLSTSPKVAEIKHLLREQRLHTVCEEATCPNLDECFGKGTATFMIMGDICTRRCPFCDVAHGKPRALDADEPRHLADSIRQLGLRYVVITSVDRDDLRDGGAHHFADCIQTIRTHSPQTRIEILVPDFRGRKHIAVDILGQTQPDIFNHNLETVPRLYRQCRPGADYAWSLSLIQDYKTRCPEIPTKSGLMLGLGESLEEVEHTLLDLREHACDMLTLGQYLQPTKHHLPVVRFVTPEEFQQLAVVAQKMGFRNVASGPMVRSSYHADQQASTLT